MMELEIGKRDWEKAQVIGDHEKNKQVRDSS